LTLVITIERRAAAVAVRVVLPEILPEAAVIVVLPAATPAARPLLFTLAMDASDELQATCAVIL
jgi:hypothetical protein